MKEKFDCILLYQFQACAEHSSSSSRTDSILDDDVASESHERKISYLIDIDPFMLLPRHGSFVTLTELSCYSIYTTNSYFPAKA
jgi:hypothetical protein